MNDISEPYFDETGPIMRRSVVAYWDILGFSKMMREAIEEDQQRGLLRRLTSVLDQLYSIYIKSSLRWARTKAFTDNLIWAYPFDDRGQFPVANVLFHIGHYQRDLALAGLFTRGAVVIGNVHVSENIVFGKAILEAIELEQRCALYPRIILGDSTIDYLETHQIVHPERAICRDDDGQYFINYLQALNGPDRDGTLKQALNTHGDILRSRLDEYADNQSIRQKYEWAMKYHSWFCNSIGGSASGSRL